MRKVKPEEYTVGAVYRYIPPHNEDHWSDWQITDIDGQMAACICVDNSTHNQHEIGSAGSILMNETSSIYHRMSDEIITIDLYDV